MIPLVAGFAGCGIAAMLLTEWVEWAKAEVNNPILVDAAQFLLGSAGVQIVIQPSPLPVTRCRPICPGRGPGARPSRRNPMMR